MSRTRGLIKRKWKLTYKEGGSHERWSYATRVRTGGKDRLFVHGTQNYGDALTAHENCLEGLEEISVEVLAPGAMGPRRFNWSRSMRVADAAREAGRAFGRGDAFVLADRMGTVLAGDLELRDTRVDGGDRLQLVLRLSVDAAFELWRQRDLCIRRGERGRREVAARFHRYVSPTLGHLQLDLLAGEHIRALRVQLDATRLQGRDRLLKPEMVRHVLSDLRCFLGWAADPTGGELITALPWPRAVMPRVAKRRPDRLTDDEVGALLGVREPHALVIRLGLATGLRWGDLCRLQASDLKRDGSGAWCFEVAVGKTGEVLRVPVVDAEVVAEVRGRVGRLIPFRTKTTSTFNRAVARRSGVERFHVHQLRHTYACRYLERGGSLAALQHLLGHASVTTTERYARLQHEHVMRDVLRVERAQAGDKTGDNRNGVA